MGFTSCELEELRATVQLSWSPFDYVDGISLEGDRALRLAHLFRPLPEAHDLRRVHRGDGGDLVVCAEILPWDTHFFGYGVARLDAMLPLHGDGAESYVYDGAIAALVADARARGVKYLFAPIDSRDTPLLRALGTFGFSLIETRVHQHRGLRDYAPAERHRIRQAVIGDVPLLERTAREMVNPFDRFHSDPFISASDADRLMSTWVRQSIAGGFADATFVPDHDRPEAFCTTKLHQENWSGWGVRLVQPVVLGAVAPTFRGWYRKLISEICVTLAGQGAEHAYFVTQITNRAALRSVEALGFRIGRGEHVLRILP